MYRVNLNRDESVYQRAERELSTSGLRQAMLPILQTTVSIEKATHTYRNRTGDLERSTEARVVQANRTEIRVVLHMGMPYARFVKGTNFPRHAERAVEQVKAALAELSRRI